jgi:hypothetical protein
VCVVSYIVTKKQNKKIVKQQKEWLEELLNLSEALQGMLSNDIKALETYKMIEEIYSMVYRSRNQIAQNHQRLRLTSYKKDTEIKREKWNVKNICQTFLSFIKNG